MRHKMHVLFTIIISAFWMFSPTVVFADSLLMPKVSQGHPDDAESVARPTRAMTMEDVVKQFGEPLQTTGPIGNPPISRWNYQKYIVVFENKYVIHSVLKSKLPRNKQ